MNEFDQSCSTNQPALESVTLPHVKTYNEQSMLAFVFDHDWTIVVLAIQWEINRKPLRGHQCISASVSSCTEKEIWWLPDAGIAPWNQTNKEYYKTASLRMMFLELVLITPHNLYWLQTEPVLITNSLYNCHGQINFFYRFLRPRYCTHFCCCSSEYDWNVCFEFFFVEFMCFSNTKTHFFFFWLMQSRCRRWTYLFRPWYGGIVCQRTGFRASRPCSPVLECSRGYIRVSPRLNRQIIYHAKRRSYFSSD